VSGEQKLTALFIALFAAVLIAVAVSSNGCQQTAQVTCPNGSSYSTQEWGGEPKLKADDAEAFCDEGNRP
jgi:hypothetical protein